ncbi:hypothetical protein HT031_003518 [Scenedesmus sp. PABB004]|nr:hypothetical protein HT031_003518 [Scenedesmus sp. PABB004]
MPPRAASAAGASCSGRGWLPHHPAAALHAALAGRGRRAPAVEAAAARPFGSAPAKVVYIPHLLSPHDFAAVQSEARKLQPQLREELNCIAKGRLGCYLPPSSAAVAVFSSRDLAEQLTTRLRSALPLSLSDFPIELRQYPKGAEMPWHLDEQLFKEPQWEMIFTIDNTSDSRTEWRDAEGLPHSVWTEPNSLLAVEAEGWEHRVVPSTRGSRTILKLAYATTTAKLPAFDANLTREASTPRAPRPMALPLRAAVAPGHAASGRSAARRAPGAVAVPLMPSLEAHQRVGNSSGPCSRCGSAQRRRQQRPAAAAAQAAPSSQPGAEDGDWDPTELLSVMASTRSYAQLAALVESQRAALLGSPLCVYALLHAVQLRDTISDEKLGHGSLASEGQVLQQLELVEGLLEQLCDAAEAQVGALPLPSQAALALALAQLDYYHAPTYAAIAAAVTAELAEKQPPQQQQQQQQQEQQGGGAAGVSAGPPRAAALAALPAALVPGVLLSLCVAFSLNGHHDEQLLEELAAQAVAFRGASPEPGPLISMAAALLDLQAYCPALVGAAADAVLAQQAAEGGGGGGARGEGAGALGADEVVSLLLCVAFFRVPAPAFVELALQPSPPTTPPPPRQSFAADPKGVLELEPQTLGRLWKALLLLAAQGTRPPPELLELFALVQEAEPDALLLGSARGAVGAEDAAAVAAAAPELAAQWADAGLLAPADMLRALEAMGCALQRRAALPLPPPLAPLEAGEDGAPPAALVDLYVTLPDGRAAAVLVLDESRYCHSPPGRLRGGAAVEVLVLQGLGLAVLPLPLAEWQALGGDAQLQARYLRARLDAAAGGARAAAA